MTVPLKYVRTYVLATNKRLASTHYDPITELLVNVAARTQLGTAGELSHY